MFLTAVTWTRKRHFRLSVLSVLRLLVPLSEVGLWDYSTITVSFPCLSPSVLAVFSPLYGWAIIWKKLTGLKLELRVPPLPSAIFCVHGCQCNSQANP